jgi:D-cysteine desulfhydrase
MNLMGADIVTINKADDFLKEMHNVAQQVSEKGGKPYIIPFGGSNLLGSLGYVECVEEIKEQSQIEADYIYTPIGSGGTQAGIIAGIVKNKMKTNVVGISVLHKTEVASKIVEDLTNETLNYFGLDIVKSEKVIIDDNFIGQGYGITTKESIETIKLLAKLEGIFLCPVYTSKAMTGLIDHIKTGKIKSNQTVIFIHTGGSPLIYAYYDKLFG